jgi:ubiquinone/menaquinone biosynthesis C-methylase UbiE
MGRLKFTGAKTFFMDKLVEKYCELPSFVRRPMWRIWHGLVSRFDKQREVTFMNYGYESLNDDAPLKLKEEDEPNRYCINLYHQVASQVDLAGMHVLEVGSGRGGGASYISRYHNPESYTAIDISKTVTDFCMQVHSAPNLSFKLGMAEKLEFSNEMFDAVVNVESARCYTDMQGFFYEVYRVLRPGSHFLFADMIKQGEEVTVEDKLSKAGFTRCGKRNITDNVVKSLNLDHNRRNQLIQSLIPKFLRGGFLEFAGVKGTERYNSFASGKMQYWIYLLEKK